MLKTVVLAISMVVCGSVLAIAEGETNTTVVANSKADARPSITTLSGVRYEHCKISRVEPDGISVYYSKGVAKIPFTDLSPELQQKYGYDPMKSAAYSRQQAELRQLAVEQQQRIAQVQHHQQQRDQELERLVRDIRKNSQLVNGRVLQIVDEGVLFLPKQKITAEMEPIFIVGVGAGLHDGADWAGTIYPAGLYQYVSVNNSGKTIKRFAVSPELAAKAQFDDQ